MFNTLYYNGHVYVNIGKFPCPLPGHEDGMIATMWKGIPAWWQEGHLYVLDSKQSVNTGQNDWVSKVKSGVQS